ncbi:MAG: putative lipid II flippase FtsW [Elusimicrobia bacterium]|nr:putative lipid II flippase FtsW [Elusimicrobiota bacterium]
MVKLFFSNFITKNFKRNKDARYLFYITSALTIIGILAVHSCSPMVNINSPYSCITKHIINIILGIICFLIANKIDYKKYQNKNLFLFTITTILLILPVFFPEHKGAHRWIDLKFFSFQPSEMAKIVLVILMADFLARNRKYINTWAKNVLPVVYVSVFCPIILFLQKDLGSTALIFCLWTIMLIIAKIDTKRFLIIALVAIFGIVLSVAIQPYRRTRVMTYANQIIQLVLGNKENTESTKTKKIDDDKYNSEIAFAAFGSGGLFGKGPGNSETKLQFLPEKHTDYIFSIIGEEYGLIGTLVTVSLFIFFVITALSINKKCPDVFGKFLSFGITLIIAIQAIVNMGMTTGVLPAKGFPLPFISYGGSSMLVNFYIIGILINIARNNSKIS